MALRIEAAPMELVRARLSAGAAIDCGRCADSMTSPRGQPRPIWPF